MGLNEDDPKEEGAKNDTLKTFEAEIKPRPDISMPKIENGDLEPESFSRKTIPSSEAIVSIEIGIKDKTQTYNKRILTIFENFQKMYPELNIGTILGLGILSMESLNSTETPLPEKPKEEGPPKFFEIGKAYGEVEKQIAEHIGELIFEGFEKGRMPMPVFYFHPEKWTAVCEEKTYTLQEKAKNILRENAEEMLEIITPEDAEKVRIYDFGIGTGEKGKIIIDKAIEKNKGKVEYHGVDASPDMLRIALERIIKEFLQNAIEMKTANNETRRTSKWQYLITFLKKNNLAYSSQPEHLEKCLERIFERHYADPENVDLIRFSFARMLSLHKRESFGMSKIEDLDDPVKVKLPISLHAHTKWFQQFDQKEFTPKEKEGVVIFDLGSEICNQFPGKSIEMFYKLLSDPKTPNHRNEIVPLRDEKSVHTNYAVLGLQLGEIPTSQTHFRTIRNEMRKAYNNPAFRELTTHPFMRRDIKYTDMETDKPVTINDIGFIYADYEEDKKDYPGYYGATHRLYITEDVEVTNVKGEKMAIKNKENAYGIFQKTVEAMFSPEREAELQGKRLEIEKVIFGENIKPNKEDFLDLDPKVFYSKNYSNYGNGMKIAKTILGEESATLHQILLYPSYKPTLEQMVELCHKRGMKIIEVYSDNPEKPTYVKILTRRMSLNETDYYEENPDDKEIFYTIKSKQTLPNGKKPGKNGTIVDKTIQGTEINNEHV